MKTRNNKTKRNRKQRNNRPTSGIDRFVAAGRTDVVPYSSTKWLNYVDSTLVRNNAGSNYLVFYMRLNSAYDPDPLLLSGSLSGFSEWAAFYQYYRVEKVQISWGVVNKEAFPVKVGFLATAAPVPISGQLAAINTLENGEAQGPATVSQAGGQDRAMLIRTYDLAKIWGNTAQYRADDNWGAVTNTNPGFLVQGAFVAYASNNFVNGLDSDLRLRFQVKFYARKQLLS